MTCGSTRLDNRQVARRRGERREVTETKDGRIKLGAVKRLSTKEN
jgi:hypothetical protein